MLTGKHRRSLRAQAHHLHAVVQIGHEGLSESVVRQVDEALAAHELIKVKVTSEAPEDRGALQAMAGQLAEQTRAEVAQQIGHVIVLFRRRPKKPRVTLRTDIQKPASRSKGHGPRRRAKAKRGKGAGPGSPGKQGKPGKPRKPGRTRPERPERPARPDRPGKRDRPPSRAKK